MSVNFFADGDAGIKVLTLLPAPGTEGLPAPTDRSEFRIAGSDRYGRITGFGMGPNVLFAGRPQGGGVTYGDIEVLQVNLGSGNDTVRVDYATNAEDHTTKRNEDFYTLTTLATGAGNDVVTVTLEDGDNSAVGDGAFAMNLQAGDDIVDAGSSLRDIVVFGGLGDDTITTGSGDDIVFGDVGRVDYVRVIELQRGGTLDEVVTRLGHSVEQNPVNPDVTAATLNTVSDSTASFPPSATDPNGGLKGLSVQVIGADGHVQFRTIVSNTADTITIDRDWDLLPVFTGDPDLRSYYRVSAYPEDQTDGMFRGPRLIMTVGPDGGNDTIDSGAGDDRVLGGAGDDAMEAGVGSDIVLGDAGRLDFTIAQFEATLLDRAATIQFSVNGSDTISGGAGADLLFGGWGDDLLNADDDHTTNVDPVSGAGLNDAPDTHPSYEDRAYGGAGRDRLIANTGGDRLIDWAGEFNSYIVPFAPFGMGTVSRTLQPQLAEFLYALSASDGADFTRGGDAARNGEPDGELGLVRQQDFAWKDQTGAPDDPQPGNIPGGPRDVLRSANFDGVQGSTAGTGFFADSGVFEATSGVMKVAAGSRGGDAVAVYHVGDQLPIYFELQASVRMEKATGGWKANAYMIFDYQNEYDFKFVGIDNSVNKLVMGHRDTSGWHIDRQGAVPGGVKPEKWYNLLVAVNGLTVTLVVDNKDVFQHTYQSRVVDGYSYALNWGMVGMGSDNARGSFDNVRVQILPPQVTFSHREDFNDGQAELFTGERSGSWVVNAGRYDAAPNGSLGLNLVDLGPDHLNFNSYLELTADVKTAGQAGLIFDRYGDESFKYAAIDAQRQKLVIGHYTQKSGWVVDASVSASIQPSQSYKLAVTLKGTTVSVTLGSAVGGGYQAIAGYVFNASPVDGNFGLFSKGGVASFDNVTIKTDDPVFTAAATSTIASNSFKTSVAAPVVNQSAVREVTDPLDTNGDGKVTALDALVVINAIARVSLPPSGSFLATADAGWSPRLDANRDGKLSALDALNIINALSRQQASAQPEWSPTSLLGGTAGDPFADTVGGDDDDELLTLLAADQAQLLDCLS